MSRDKFMIRPSVCRASLCLLAALVVLIYSASARAQSNRTQSDIDTPGLVIEASVGWDGTVDLSAPVPVSFLISNQSDKVIEGRLTLSDPMMGRVVNLGEIYISPNSTKRFASIQALSNWYECFATLSDGRRTLWRRELTLNTATTFDPNFNFALVIDRRRKLHLGGGGTGCVAQQF